ncbi:hypothetical protein [Liquorilactobacillus satsumensis]|uniref:Uncharacterized protein n=1 Tax=Liquorilactobacillus satsumensis DSM 16230 = JCM 12392 TaxID=1423801 RepID=A0A0R1UW23_9LACO|nr:hypothetical protein [Liquorilactobacillus satsumensis]KRL97424.1 hypothetical protein FD50_GL001405 [Liquorilactobacillus satsumensis DSM 16230 = JCM 12392]
MDYSDIVFNGTNFFENGIPFKVRKYETFFSMIHEKIKKDLKIFDFIWEFFSQKTSRISSDDLLMTLDNQKHLYELKGSWTDDLCNLYKKMVFLAESSDCDEYALTRTYSLEMITELFLEKKLNVPAKELFHEPAVLLGDKNFFPEDEEWSEALVDFCYKNKERFFIMCDSKANITNFRKQGLHKKPRLFHKISLMKYFKEKVENELKKSEVELSISTFQQSRISNSVYPFNNVFRFFTRNEIRTVFFG